MVSAWHTQSILIHKHAFTNLSIAIKERFLSKRYLDNPRAKPGTARKLEMIPGSRRTRPMHGAQSTTSASQASEDWQPWVLASSRVLLPTVKVVWEAQKGQIYSDLWNEQSCQISCIQFHSNTHLSSEVIGFEKSVKLSTNYEWTENLIMCNNTVC